MCGKKRHTKTEIRSEMSDLICGRIAAGENYNLTRDSKTSAKAFRDNSNFALELAPMHLENSIITGIKIA